MIRATCPVCKEHEFHCNKCGSDLTEHIDSLVDKPIKPKDEKMDGKYITARASGVSGSYDVSLNMEEAERVGEEAKRIKAEIAKREEIGAGDWLICGKKILRCTEVIGFQIMTSKENYAFKQDCKKLHPTPEIKAWLDKAIGGEG